MHEPGYEPPGANRGERLGSAGRSMEAAGRQMASCGGSLVALGCGGFLLILLVAIVIAVLSGGSKTSASNAPSYIPAEQAVEEASKCEKEASRWPTHCHPNGEVIWPTETEQKDREAREREENAEKKAANAEREAIREGQRLKEEGKVPEG